MISGFPGSDRLHIVKLRLYDGELSFLTESSAGEDLHSGLPAFLRAWAERREGAERLEAIGGLWRGPRGPLYSQLLPIGGLRVAGYLEVVVDPLSNLREVARMARIPMRIEDGRGQVLLQIDEYSRLRPEAVTLPVHYALNFDDGGVAYRLVGSEDVSRLHEELRHTQLMVTGTFILLFGIAVLTGILFFRRFVFQPLAAMQAMVERYAQGELSVVPPTRTLREFRQLAEAFNCMAQQLSDNMLRLQRLSNEDGLTGIANRRLFSDMLWREWRRCARSGEALSLILIDVDHFKKYNDYYGHPAGDECLKSVARIMAAAVHRSTDLVARYGGEEFVILLPATGREGAERVAERIAEALARLNLPHAASSLGRVTLSQGCISCIPREDCEPTILIEGADKVLYTAKQEGRNRIHVAPCPYGRE